jgi:hypothetical protein
MMAGAGGAMRATGWRATAIRFQQFDEGVAHELEKRLEQGQTRDRDLLGSEEI